jgi:hypothetical protein
MDCEIVGCCPDKTDALRPTRSEIDLNQLLMVLLEPCEPSLSEKGLLVRLRCCGPTRILADIVLLHRMIDSQRYLKFSDQPA